MDTGASSHLADNTGITKPEGFFSIVIVRATFTRSLNNLRLKLPLFYFHLVPLHGTDAWVIPETIRSLDIAACASWRAKTKCACCVGGEIQTTPAFDFICASLESILAIEDTWERERSGFAEEKVWGDIPVVTGFWGGKEDFLGELAVWSPEDV
ncbi:hypothetical protein Tco_0209483 [Tanacetum coccineum]